MINEEIAEVSADLFCQAERLARSIAARKMRPSERTLWDALVGQIDTIASIIAQEDELCDGCGVKHATDVDMMCDACRIADDTLHAEQVPGWVR